MYVSYFLKITCIRWPLYCGLNFIYDCDKHGFRILQCQLNVDTNHYSHKITYEVPYKEQRTVYNAARIIQLSLFSVLFK